MSKKSTEIAPLVTAETAATEPKEQVAAATASRKVTAKPKAVAEKPAPTPETDATPLKKTSRATKEKIAETPKVEQGEKSAKVKKHAPKKPKLVRDSFTIPETDYALFASLKLRALTAGIDVKKGEILRAAVATLATLDDAELVKAFDQVERIKTGRPKK